MINIDAHLLPSHVHQDHVVVSPTSLDLNLPPASSGTPDVLSLFNALRRRWKSALGVGLVVALIASFSAYLIVPKPKFTSRATLHVSTNPKYIIFDPKERLADYRTYQRTQVAMAKSLFVLSDALRNPRIADLPSLREQNGPVEWLARSIKIDFPDASEVLEIALSGEHVEDIEVIVNAVVDSYMKLVVDEEQNERKTRLVKLKDLWRRYQGNLSAKRAELQKLSEVVGSNDKQVLLMAHQLKIQRRDFAEQEHLRVTFELRKAEAELAVLVARADEVDRAPLPQTEIDERIEASPVIQSHQGKIRKLTNSLGQITRLSRAENEPAATAIRRELDSEKRELAVLRKEMRPTIVAAIQKSARKDDWETLASLRGQVSVLKTYMESIEHDLGRLQGESKTFSRESMDLSQQQDELQIVSETAKKIGAEVEAMEVELGAPSRVRIVDRATVPGNKDEFRKVKAGVVAGAGSFLVIVVAITLWEFNSRRIDSTAQVVNGLHLRLVGSLPNVRPQAFRLDSEVRDRAQSSLIESIDATRTMLLHEARLKGIQSLMITSASQGEGKTSLSFHLAISLARSGRQTLLVDADLRDPVAHKLFDIPEGPGLSEILRGEAVFDEVVRATPVVGLDLLPAGASDALAIQALSQHRARSLFDQLKGRYDFVIVDTAPVLPVADTLLFGQMVDAVIFSILRDVSRTPMVQAAHERLSNLGVKILGAVVSGTPNQAHLYGYPSGKKDKLALVASKSNRSVHQSGIHQ